MPYLVWYTANLARGFSAIAASTGYRHHHPAASRKQGIAATGVPPANVYKDGVLRPLEPLLLEELQQVTVTITDPPVIDDDLAGYFTPEEWAEAARDGITWDDVRQAFSKIAGSLSGAVIAQRQER